MEVMACPGGCIGGGGQAHPDQCCNQTEPVDTIYAEDMSMTVRKSHENPEIAAIYEVFLELNGHKVT
ncbi:MAG: iron hydrogenase small subunit [Bacteroidales bacterium]